MGRARTTTSETPAQRVQTGFAGRVPGVLQPVALALLMVLGEAGIARGQEIINRREQARGMLLVSPQGIYRHYCAHCHGDDAGGGGRLWSTELSPRPADLTTLGKDEEYLVTAIRDGSVAHGKSNLCPPWGRTIAPADIKRLARYIVSLASETPSDPQAPARGLSEPSTFDGPARGLSAPVNEPFPWLLGAVLVVETVVLLRMLRARKEVLNVVRDPRPPGGKEAST